MRLEDELGDTDSPDLRRAEAKWRAAKQAAQEADDLYWNTTYLLATLTGRLPGPVDPIMPDGWVDD